MLLALTRQGLQRPEAAKDVYVGYAPGKIASAIRKATELREEGQVVELAAAPGTEAEARALANQQGYSRLLYLQ